MSPSESFALSCFVLLRFPSPGFWKDAGRLHPRVPAFVKSNAEAQAVDL